MAKIVLTIEADSANDLAETLANLAGSFVDEGVEVSSDPAPAARRGRPRNKPPAAAASDTNASGALETTAPAAGAEAGPTATADASPSDAGPTRATITKLMSDGMEATSALKVQEALAAEGLPTRASEIPPEKYGEAAKVIEKLIALS